jgi:hypothetical protein
VADTSHLYILHDRAVQRVKIGKARDVPRRIAQLQTGSSTPLEFMLFMAHCGWLEATIHAAFGQYRAQGEWFTCSGPVVRFIESMWPRKKWREGRGEHVGATDVLACLAMSLDPTIAEYEPSREMLP